MKSRGIAQDIFGYTQDYVIPVEELQDNSDLLKKFLWMLKNEKNIKDKLIKKIPEYVRSTGISSEIARDLLLDHEKKVKASILLNDKKKCCGCLACVNICSYNAIKIVTDKEGFKYPQINSEVCVYCGKCSEVCPVVTPRAYNKDLPELKGAYAKNIKIREISSSGGIFYLLGKYFLERKGVVFGAAWNGDNKLVHQRITEISKLDKLCGSKYVQSDMGNIYQYVKNDLEKGKMVYFSGTPCQVKALKLFLGQSYEKLLTQDFICHGVPSPEVLQKYTDEVLDGACANQIFFRSKKKGWSNFSFEIIGREHMYHCVFNEDPFFHAFLREYSFKAVML